MVLREKFSRSQFLGDVQKYGCTVVQYIGELARYLVSEEDNDSKNNKLRIALGNGLRPEIWEKFQNKYGIERIVEFYGSTEGTAALVNRFNKVGAVGWSPNFFSITGNPFVVKYDPITTELLRDSNGKFDPFSTLFLPPIFSNFL